MNVTHWGGLDMLSHRRLSHSPNDSECGKLLKVKGKIHAEVCPEQSSDCYWKMKRRRGEICTVSVD